MSDRKKHVRYTQPCLGVWGQRDGGDGGDINYVVYLSVLELWDKDGGEGR